MGSATSIIKLSLQSNQYEQGLRGAKKQFEDFAASIGINMKKLTAYGLAAGAAASAINSMTSAISTAMTEGTRMAKEMEGVRAAFNRLNQPGLLDNLRDATHGTVNDLELMKQAVKFDNFNLSLDQMGTMLAFAQQQAKDTGQDVGYLVDSIVTGLGRKSLPILDNLGLSATEIRERMKETGDMTKAVADIIKDRMEAAGGYVETAADRAAKATADMENAMIKLGETFGPITENSDSLWNSIKVGAINALNSVGDLINYLHEAGRISKIIGNMNGGGMMERFGNNLRNSKDPSSLYQRQLAEINRSINSAEAKLQQAEKGGMGSIQIYRERVQALKEIKSQYQELYQTITRPTKSITTTTDPTKTPKGGRSGGSKSDITYAADSIAAQEKLVQDLNKAWQEAGSGVRDSYLPKIVEAEAKLKSMKNEAAMLKEQAAGKLQGGWVMKTNLGSDSFAKDYLSVGAGLSSDKLPPITGGIEDMTKALQEQRMAFNLAGQAANSFSAALAGMEDTAAKAAGQVVSAIASIAMGFAMASSNADTAGTGWGWLAWLAAGASAMATTIATIHSLTGYAEGGIVKGNSYSGDNMMFGGDGLYGLNSGELVLTKAMQGNLASQLSGGAQNLQLDGVISGENIHIVHSRYLKRTGQGEIVTWR